MPTENERKYVLYNDPAVIHEIAKKAQKLLAIEQAWPHNGPKWSVRIRKVSGPHFSNPQYFMTYKRKVSQRLIEIETVIEERDYYDILNSSDTNKTILQKTRYIIPSGALKWEVDLFYNQKRTEIYFVMAEIELPEGVMAPVSVPDFIKTNLLFEVPYDNTSFTSRKLQDIEYASSSYNKLMESVA